MRAVRVLWTLLAVAQAGPAPTIDHGRTDAEIRRRFFDGTPAVEPDPAGAAWLPEPREVPSAFPPGYPQPAGADTLKEARALAVLDGFSITRESTTEAAFIFEGKRVHALPIRRVWRTDFYRPLRTHVSFADREDEPLGRLRVPSRATAERLAALLWAESVARRLPLRVLKEETIETDDRIRVVRHVVERSSRGGGWDLSTETFELTVDRRDGSVTRRIAEGREIPAPCPQPAVVAAGRTPEGVTIDVRIDAEAVTPGASDPAANVTISLENETREDVWMDFGDPCFLSFRVERPDGARVPYAEASNGCIMMTAGLRLRPGERFEQTRPWSANDDASRPLAPGTYAIVGTLARHSCGGRGQLPASASRQVTVAVLGAR